MKPLSIVLSINFTFYLIFFLFFAVVVDRPELIPLFSGFLALMNLLFAGGFMVDKKKNLYTAFLISFAITLAITLVGFYIIGTYGPEIRGDEIRTFLQGPPLQAM